MEKLLTLFILTVLAFTVQESSGAWERSRIVCYYGSWSNIDHKIPAEKCTHVYYSFIGLDDRTWKVKFLDGDDNWTRTRLRQFLTLKSQYPGTKFLIAIGGGAEGSDKYSRMAEVQSRRATFIQSIKDFLAEYNFDGVDVDWEYPGVDWTGGREMDKRTFPVFVQELRNALNQMGRPLEITMAVSISEYVMSVGYDVPKLCQILDAVHLMVYDLRGPWESIADVHSAIYPRATDTGDWLKYNLNYAGPMWNRAGCPAHKLIVGMPFYGHELVVYGESKPGARVDQDATNALPGAGYVTYNKLCKYLSDSTWSKVFDYEVGCPYMTKNNRFLGYDNSQSIRFKTDWIKSHYFGGGMVWAIEEDDHDGVCGPKAPLIQTLYDNLKDYYVEKP